MHEASYLKQCIDIVFKRCIGDTTLAGVRAGAAELFLRHFLMGHGLDDFRASHEHIRRVTHHKNEIGHGWGIHRTTGTRAHYQRDLRYDT